MTETEKLDRLEMWATFAAEALQEICDDAQDAAGDPGGDSECKTIRALIKDLDDILLPSWQQQIAQDACDTQESLLNL